MILYAIILMLIGIIFLFLTCRIYQGHTQYIHDYHQLNINEKDKVAYGKAFSKGLLVIALSSLVSGFMALFTKFIFLSVGIFVLGMIIAVVILVKVQKKFNKGIFS